MENTGCHQVELGALASSGSRSTPDAGGKQKGTDAPKTEVRLSPGPEEEGRRVNGIFSLK